MNAGLRPDHPPAGKAIAIRAEPGEVRTASRWLEASAAAGGVPAGDILRLDTCLNEVLANVIAHGGDTARHAPVRIALAIREGEATLTVMDAGVTFDPMAFVPRPPPQTLDEAQPGGLGIVMLREYADAIAYERCGGENRLTFGVRWAAKA